MTWLYPRYNDKDVNSEFFKEKKIQKLTVLEDCMNESMRRVFIQTA